MRFLRLFVLSATFCIIPFAAIAQYDPPRFEVFAEGGGSFLNQGTGVIPGPTDVPCVPTQFCPGSPATGSYTKSGRLFFGGRVRFTRRNAFEASYSYSPNHFSVQQGTVSSGTLYNRVDFISFNYVRYLWTRSPLQPFATAGLGINRFSGPQFAYIALVFPPPVSSYINNSNQFAFNYGGGVDFVLRRHFALRFELRDYVTGQPSFFTGTSHNLAPTAGIVFRFK